MARKMTEQEVKDKLSVVQIKLLDKYINTRTKVRLQCHCGKEFISHVGLFTYGGCNSCGCGWGLKNRKDISGQRFGQLVAILPTQNHAIGNSNGVYWDCLCSCGELVSVPLNKLKIGNTKSCGCLKTKYQEIIGKVAKEYYKTHTGENHPSYNHNMTDEERKVNNRRPLIATWRRKVFKKHGKQCCVCESSENLRTHHKDSWHWCIERRLDENNGAVMCEECHTKYHQEFGYYNNTEQQFNEYISCLRSS